MSCVGNAIEPGDTFGYLTVRALLKKRASDGQRRYRCECVCGATVKRASSLLKRGGDYQHCGCKRAEVSSITRTMHGMEKHRLYPTWAGMMTRCYNKGSDEYHVYGGRGIEVCKPWHEPAAFIAWAESHGWKPRLQLDRIDNDAGYSPGNCRFVTPSQNCRNKQYNVYCEYKGERRLFIEVWEEIGKGKTEYMTAKTRFQRGWDIKAACTEPSRIPRRAA